MHTSELRYVDGRAMTPSGPRPALFALSPVNAERCGFIIWSSEGTVESIGVAPWLRRQGIATELWNQARGFSGLDLDRALRRTVLGDAWFHQGLKIDPPLHGVLPPFTKHSDAAGATQRQLVVDDVEATVDRLLGIFGRGPEDAPGLRALCAPTSEDAARRLRELGQWP